MKGSGRHLSKKGLIGLKRIGVGKDRVWVYRNKEYKTLRQVISSTR